MLSALEFLPEILEEENGLSYISNFISYSLTRAGKSDTIDFKNLLSKYAGEKTGEDIMKSAYEEIYEEAVHKVYGEAHYKGLVDGMHKGMLKGKLEGRLEEKRQIAFNLINQRASIELICAATGLSVQQIKDIKKTITLLS